MNITKADIYAIPQPWAEQLAWDLDPDGDLMRSGYDAYAIIRENWPECREEVEDLLAEIQNLESNHG